MDRRQYTITNLWKYLKNRIKNNKKKKLSPRSIDALHSESMVKLMNLFQISLILNETNNPVKGKQSNGINSSSIKTKIIRVTLNRTEFYKKTCCILHLYLYCCVHEIVKATANYTYIEACICAYGYQYAYVYHEPTCCKEYDKLYFMAVIRMYVC